MEVRTFVRIQRVIWDHLLSDFLTEMSACVVLVFRLLWATVAIFVEASNDAR